MEAFLSALTSVRGKLAPLGLSPLAENALLLGVTGLTVLFTLALLMGDKSGLGNGSSFGQFLFSLYVRLGRLRHALCRPVDRARQRYPVANTCQLPFFSNLGDLYTFVFGWKPKGTFVEVGAYDGESFSNTSGLADLGWRGHYIEPIPDFAKATQQRHKANKNVSVHCFCAGEKDGETVQLSAAGPFTSAVEDEISSVANSNLHSVLSSLGWGHNKAAPRVNATTKTLNSFCKEQGMKAGEIDVMVVDTEGFEWPILRAFDLAAWKPKLVIVEVQELQARYRDNQRVQQDATALFAKFQACGYSILYKDVVNTVFIHKDCHCVGGN